MTITTMSQRKNLDGRNVQFAGTRFTPLRLAPFDGSAVKRVISPLKVGMLF
jgi:hypothetical protein